MSGNQRRKADSQWCRAAKDAIARSSEELREPARTVLAAIDDALVVERPTDPDCLAVYADLLEAKARVLHYDGKLPEELAFLDQAQQSMPAIGDHPEIRQAVWFMMFRRAMLRIALRRGGASAIGKTLLEELGRASAVADKRGIVNMLLELAAQSAQDDPLLSSTVASELRLVLTTLSDSDWLAEQSKCLFFEASSLARQGCSARAQELFEELYRGGSPARAALEALIGAQRSTTSRLYLQFHLLMLLYESDESEAVDRLATQLQAELQRQGNPELVALSQAVAELLEEREPEL